MADIAPDQVARLRDGQSFRFQHTLAHSPLLTYEAMKDIARQLLDERRFDQVLFTDDPTGANKRYATPETRDQVLAALEGLDTGTTWLRLTRIDVVRPEIRDIVERFYDDLSERTGVPVRPNVIKTLVTLFIGSPGALTPYHMDHTWNFLLQIVGRKTVHLYDANDSSIVSHVDRERFYVGASNLKQAEGAAPGIAYDLPAGYGVHHPVNAPHWVQNGAARSISLSLGICLKDATRLAHIHQANYLLRRLGLSPAPPGRNSTGDALKAGFIDLLQDRHPESFDEIVSSGWHRLMRWKSGRFFASP